MGNFRTANRTIVKTPQGVERPSAVLHLVQSTRFAKKLAKLLLIGLLISIVGMAFLPWQQTSRGEGTVIAYAPQERQQVVEAPIKGVVSKIDESLIEGSVVKKGQFLLEVEPFAADTVEQLNRQMRELKIKEEAAMREVEALAGQVQAYTEAREFTISAAKQMVEAAKAKLKAKLELIPGYQAKELQAKLNYDRQEALAQKALKPYKEVEKLRKDLDVATSELKSLGEDIESLKKEVSAKEEELEEKKLLAKTKIDYAVAQEQKAQSSLASIRKDVSELSVKLKEFDRLRVVATRDGTIFRMPIQVGQAVKEGEMLLTIVPEATQKAVELSVNGNDMPLVQTGQEVRLQFEGWPAVQFAGWPSVAVGTFSGEVITVDPTDNGKGQFRILVTPTDGEDWPDDRYLRQGVRTNGWVMLRQVSLGYELWRQLNGFPVILSDKEPGKSKTKVPKLPK